MSGFYEINDIDTSTSPAASHHLPGNRLWTEPIFRAIVSTAPHSLEQDINELLSFTDTRSEEDDSGSLRAVFAVTVIYQERLHPNGDDAEDGGE